MASSLWFRTATPKQLAEAAAALIEDPDSARRMVTAQTAFAETTAWTEVGLEYLRLTKELNTLVSV